MTCEQLAIELQPYAESIHGSLTAFGDADTQLQLGHAKGCNRGRSH